jgi:hypothetical protein
VFQRLTEGAGERAGCDVTHNSDPKKELDDKASKPRGSGHAHPITIDKILVHKYADSEALLRKADKIARDIIDADLREGEYLEVLKPGKYRLYFPKLRSDAGDLRCATILAQIERAVRHLNPTAFHLREAEDGFLAPVATKEATKRGEKELVDPKEVEMRELATQAVKMMARNVVSREEFVDSPTGRILQASLELRFLPVWNVKSRLISAYESAVVRRGDLAASKVFQGVEAVEVKAIIDMIVYALVGIELKRRLAAENKALLLCPVHASTLTRARYVSAFLASGTDVPAAARKSLVFLVKDLNAPLSRLKVRDLAGYLRPRSRGLVAETTLNIEGVSAFKEFGFHGLRASASTERRPEDDLLKAMNVFAERCEKAKLESFIGDLRTKSVALAALASGCSYLSGSVIAKRSGRKGSIETFELDSLFG